MISHNYLPQQFADIGAILAGIRDVVSRGDFTLGQEVGEFEREFAQMVGTKHAIGVANGTDALFLALRVLGVRSRFQEVITTPYSFYATSASIWNAGGTPVYVDVGIDSNIVPKLIEAAITPNTVGIVPVHWAGRPCDMEEIMSIARRRSLWVLEDCAHAPASLYRGRKCGSFGDMAAFSLHPLKNVNVWGDGGVVVTNHGGHAAALQKLRNHGMTNRDTCEFWGHNSRLDTVQAVVARHVLAGIAQRTAKRRENAAVLHYLLGSIKEVTIPKDLGDSQSNYYLYSILVEHRDELKAHLFANGVDAKVHYPVPLHLQPAARSLGYKRGDFPGAERCAATTLSLPVHEWVTDEQLNRMGALIKDFYAGR